MTQTRTLTHRASTHHKQSVDIPNALRPRLLKLAKERKRGVGPLLCELAEERINEIEQGADEAGVIETFGRLAEIRNLLDNLPPHVRE